jgi:hypothetical protein
MYSPRAKAPLTVGNHDFSIRSAAWQNPVTQIVMRSSSSVFIAINYTVEIEMNISNKIDGAA